MQDIQLHLCLPYMVQKKLNSEKKYTCATQLKLIVAQMLETKISLAHERNANTPTLLKLFFCRILLQHKWHQLLSDPSVLLHHPPAQQEFCLLI